MRLAEGVGAAGHGALVRPLPRVALHVTLQVVVIDERLAAARVLAREWFLRGSW